MEIKKRNISFRLGDAPAPRWCDNDEVRTAFFDAFSLFLPLGEPFFIRSVHAYNDKITDPVLRRDIRDFSAQEALHTREHQAYNNALLKEGVALDEIYARVDRLLAHPKTKLERLAITVGLEHLTACLGHVILTNPEILENADPRYRDIWTWHALEEIEHKAVAFDVFRHVTAHIPKWKTYILRCAALFLATKHISRMHLRFAVEILSLRGHSNPSKAKRKVLWTMLGTPGLYRRVFWYYLKFFRPGFYPSVGERSTHLTPWLDYFNQRHTAGQHDHAQ